MDTPPTRRGAGYSYAATLNAVIWQGCRPIFADIDAVTLSLDPARVEDAIAPDTSTILATHVYGLPGDHAALADIAARRGLRLVYDGAHAFGATLHGRSLLGLGDASAVSFHATKVFHTAEGGGVFCADAGTDRRAALIKTHGVAGDEVPLAGLNAKMSELHAAMGMSVLAAFDGIVARRRTVFETYRAALSDLPLRLLQPEAIDGFAWNYPYCPAIFDDGATVGRVQAALRAAGVEARRYFRPALNTLAHADGGPCPVAERMSERALCLPFGASMDPDRADRVARILRAAL